MKKKIFLTGASGKLGSTLISYLEKNYNLISLDNLLDFEKNSEEKN